jgi:hypothetical protein
LWHFYADNSENFCNPIIPDSLRLLNAEQFGSTLILPFQFSKQTFSYKMKKKISFIDVLLMVPALAALIYGILG